MLKHEELTDQVIGAAIEVHRELGPGLLESAYQACLCRELSLRDVRFEQQVPLPVEYKGLKLDCGYEMDLLVADTVVVELKAVKDHHDVFDAQLLTYMKLARKSVGLLLNFHVSVLRNGLRRKIL